MNERIILGPEDVAEGADWLAKTDPVLGTFIVSAGPLPLRLKPDGFAALLHAIIGQQISVASAEATWARIRQAGLDKIDVMRAATEDDLRTVGFSRPKMRYAKALAAADIDYVALRGLPTEQVIGTLVTLPGIGTWTAEIYAMFSLGRADAFAAGDLAIQEAAKIIYGLPERPNEKAMRAMAETWSPWRSVAARALWEYYLRHKQRPGVA